MTFFSLTTESIAIDLSIFEKELTTSGVVGEIHGSVSEAGMTVFTYRNPQDFFDHIEPSLIPGSEALRARFKTLNRHDRVRVVGKILKNPSPQIHIEVSQIEVLVPYTQTPDYKRDLSLWENLKLVKEATFLVHAIGGGGKVIVLEISDLVIPLYVRNGDEKFTQNLVRGDVVRIKYRVQGEPSEPIHLRLDGRATDPVTVVNTIREIHEKSLTLEGELVQFPKSPQIQFNVFGILQSIPDTSEGTSRQFTLVQFDSPEVFAAIRKKLQGIWDQYPQRVTPARNKLILKGIRVRATGKGNWVDANQANPQLILKSAEDVQLIP